MRKKVLPILIAVLMIFTFAPLESFADDSVISNSAIDGVTPPVKGNIPVTIVTETDEYTGTVAWSDNPSVFASNTEYIATITITPKTGYTLTGVAKDSFSVAGATEVANAADSGVITAKFPKTEPDSVISLSVIDGVTAPVTGATPVSSITATAEYTGTVAWSGNPATFEANTVYTATIILTPQIGYTVVGVSANYFTVSGITGTNAANSGIITVEFLKTVPLPPQLLSAETSTNGDKVTLVFDKAMSDPSADKSSFNVQIHGLQAYNWSGQSNTVNLPININSAALNAGDPQKIDLTLATPLQRGDIVTVDYTPGTVTAADGGALAGFPAQPVTNTIPVNITSNLEGTWQIFDHVGNWLESYYPDPPGDDSRGRAFNRHIVISGSAVTFFGNGILPFIDFLYLPSSETAAKGFTYDLDLTRTDWHTLEGGGFLFNTVIDGGGKLSGYAVLFAKAQHSGESYTVKLYEFDNVDVNTLHNYNISYNSIGLAKYSGVTLHSTFPVLIPGTKHSISLETSSTTLNMWDGSTQLIKNYALPNTEGKGNGVGLIGSYIDHSCSSLSYFTFSALKIQGIADLSAVMNGGAAALTFTAPEGATSVIVEQSADGGVTWQVANATPISATSTTATVTGLSSNQLYHFRLNITGGKYNGYSRIATAQFTETPIATPPPSQPSSSTVKYKLTINKIGEGTVLPVPGDYSFDANTIVMLVATPADGYTFDGWTGTTGNSVYLDKEKTITAVFKQIVTAPPATPEPSIEPPASPTPEPEVIPEETPPIAPPILPETGGIPVELFFGFGGLATAAGILIRRKRKGSD